MLNRSLNFVNSYIIVIRQLKGSSIYRITYFLLSVFLFTLSYSYFLKPFSFPVSEKQADVIKEKQDDSKDAFVNFLLDEEESRSESEQDQSLPVCLLSFLAQKFHPEEFKYGFGTGQYSVSAILHLKSPVFIRIHSLLI